MDITASESGETRRKTTVDGSGMLETMKNRLNHITGVGDDDDSSVPRLISPRGRRRVRPRNLPWTGSRLDNLFRALVNVSWQGQLLLLWCVNMVSWTVFAGIWYLVQIYEIPPQGGTCISNVNSFYDALLFSMMTQTTIGYGYRYVENGCYSAVGILWVQMLLSLLFDSIMIAVVLSKITHPKLRQSTIYFSKIVCVHQEGDGYVLSVRMADMSDGIMPEAHVRMYLVHSTDKGGSRQLIMEDLDVGYDNGLDRLILLVPWIVEHRITPSSPLYGKSWNDFKSDHFEVIVLLEGGVEETGTTAQIIKSYVSEDIKWGHRFQSMLIRKGARYIADYNSIDKVEFQPDMPIMSMKEWEEGRTGDGGQSNTSTKTERNVVYAGYNYNPDSDPEIN